MEINTSTINPLIIETDENGNLINTLNHELQALQNYAQSLYSYVNKMYYDLNDMIISVKSEVHNLHDLIKDNELKEKNDIDELITELSARCLILETEIEKINKNKLPNLKAKKNEFVSQELLKDTLSEIKTREERNTDEIKRLIRENLTNANIQHKAFIDFKKDYEIEINPIINQRNTDYMIAKPHTDHNLFVKKESLLQTKQELSTIIAEKNHELLETVKSLINGTSNEKINNFDEPTRTQVAGEVNTIKQNLENIAEYHTGEIFSKNHDQTSLIRIDCDVLFLVDSNLYRMDCAIMNHGTKCQKYHCPLIKDVLKVIENGEDTNGVKQVFIQCGTNDLDNQEVDSTTFRLSDVIDKAKQKFKGAKIVISSILPRKDKRNEVVMVNDYLLNLCDITKQVKLMENLEINEHMLRDRKHLNDNGFKKLLTNIRYNMFGKLPRFSNNHINTRYQQYKPRFNDNRYGPENAGEKYEYGNRSW